MYILASAYGAFARFILPWQIVDRFRLLVNLFVPERLLFFYFFPAFIAYSYYQYLSPLLVSLFGPQVGYGRTIADGKFILLGDQEIPEILLALGFMLFVATNRWRQLSGEFDDLQSRPVMLARKSQNKQPVP
jgi:hypothetical protein